jgi:hypothetical protein
LRASFGSRGRELAPQLFLELLDAPLELAALLLGEGEQLVLLAQAGEQLLVLGEPAAGRRVLAVERHHVVDLGERAVGIGVRLVVGQQGRVGQALDQLRVGPFELGEFFDHGITSAPARPWPSPPAPEN